SFVDFSAHGRERGQITFDKRSERAVNAAFPVQEAICLGCTFMFRFYRQLPAALILAPETFLRGSGHGPLGSLQSVAATLPAQGGRAAQEVDRRAEKDSGLPCTGSVRERTRQLSRPTDRRCRPPRRTESAADNSARSRSRQCPCRVRHRARQNSPR